MTSVLITGARGYIGSTLARRLAADGYALRLVSRSEFGPLELEPNARFKYCQADLRNPRSWDGLLHDAVAIVSSLVVHGLACD